MCGIHGGINISVKNSIQSIKHRGPDFQDFIEYNINDTLISLGHTRLSIVDLSESGNQPMISDDGEHIIVFNGEIYNHQELRDCLSYQNFKGHSDTETILYYLIENGIEGVKDFNGIFAFSYFNKKAKKLFIVRDPFGVKPLYYYHNKDKFIFASEIKAIHSAGVEKKINKDLLSTFLRLRYLPSPYSLYTNINKLEPGKILTIDVGESIFINQSSFMHVPRIDKNITREEAKEIYGEKLKKAVRRQLMADVPISFLLSGGVDSALLAQIIKFECNYDINCYTAGYKIKSDIDEIDDATQTATELGLSKKNVILSEEDFLNQLPQLINIIEEPLGSQSIFPIFYLTEQIKNDGFKVAMSGQGIDEPMGGYKKYRAQKIIDTISKIPFSSRVSKLFSHIKSDDLRRIFKAIESESITGRIKESISFFDESMLKNLFRESFDNKTDISEQIIYDRIKEYNIGDKSTSEIMMNLDARMNLSDDLLLYTDKISMYNSVELRVPYLDLELVNFLESIPSQYKINHFKNKILHKEFSAKVLPPKIVNRKKKGFYTPRKIWFKGKVGEYFINEMKKDDTLFSSIFNKDYIFKMFDLHKKSKVNYEKQLYLLIVLFVWIKQNN